MTREEARQIIAAWLVSSKGEKGQCGYIEGWFYEKDAEAFYMAIEALEQEPTAEYSSDVISRKAAIEAVHSYFKDKLDELPTEIDEDGYEVYCDMKKVNMFLSDNKHLSKKIKNLPSAQLKCKTDGDTISRQAAMNELKEMQDYISYKIFCAENNPTEYAEDYIRNMEQQSVGIAHTEHRILELPSAQPEIIRCKDCKHLQKWRSEESAKEFGQIYACARNVFDCPKPEDFCSFAERRAE